MERVKIKSNINVEKLSEKIDNKYKNDDFFNEIANEIKSKTPNIDYAYLIDIVESKKLCQGCNHLNMCKQKLSGYLLSYDGENVVRIPCKYTNDQDNIKEYFKNMKYTTIKLSNRFPKLSDIDKSTMERADIVAHFINGVANNTNKGAFLSGSPGSGKTFIIESIMDYYLKQNKVAYILINDLILKLNALYYSFNHDDKLEFNKTIHILKRVPYLFIDDLGSEKVDAFSRDDVLFPILDYRMNNKLTTYFTSNYSLNELKDHYQETSSKIREPIKAERLYERIRVLADEFILKEKQSRR